MDARLQRLFLQPGCRHMTAPELAVAIRRESITVTPYAPLEWVTVCPSPHRAFPRAGLARIRRSRHELRKLPTGRSRHGCALRVSWSHEGGRRRKPIEGGRPSRGKPRVRPDAAPLRRSVDDP